MKTPQWFADKCPGQDFEEFLAYTAWYAHFLAVHGAAPDKATWEALDGRARWAWRSAAASVYVQAELAASGIEI